MIIFKDKYYFYFPFELQIYGRKVNFSLMLICYEKAYFTNNLLNLNPKSSYFLSILENI